MSFLLFMDESGHDHKQMPYEVRGGIALHASRVWGFSQQMRRLELDTFGVHLHDFGSEIKGEKLLAADRFKWAAQTDPKTKNPYAFADEIRRNLAKEFLERGKENAKRAKSEEPINPPGRLHLTAYGQACLHMAQNTMRLLWEHDARLFAVAIPRGANKPTAGYSADYLRKDLVYLFERYAYFLEAEEESGLVVMDQVEETNDRIFGQRIARYFAKSALGHERASRIMPVPLFVSSNSTYATQAADLCIYAINWGFRLPERGMDADKRPEIAERFGPTLSKLQWRGEGKHRGDTFPSYGIVYVAEPYGMQNSTKKEGGNTP